MEPALEAILYTAGESGVTLGELAGILEIRRVSTTAGC